MSCLITRGDMILPTLQAASADDGLPILDEEGTVLVGREDVTDLVEACYHAGLLTGCGTDTGDRCCLTGAGRVLLDALLVDPSLTEKEATR